MTNYEREYGWEAIIRSVGKDVAPAEAASIIGALLKYHQYVLHPDENPASEEKLKKIEEETFSHLSDDQKRVLKEAHSLLTPHKYFG